MSFTCDFGKVSVGLVGLYFFLSPRVSNERKAKDLFGGWLSNTSGFLSCGLLFHGLIL